MLNATILPEAMPVIKVLKEETNKQNKNNNEVSLTKSELCKENKYYWSFYICVQKHTRNKYIISTIEHT